MELASPVTRREASDSQILVYDQKLKIQYTGEDAETIFFEGPAEGKQWEVRTSLRILESDV